MVLDVDSSVLEVQLSRRRFLFFATLAGACVASPAGWAFQRPVETPAMSSDLITRTPLMAVALAGKRIVAVGLRGGIVYSDDQGGTWTQARVPVSTDLLDVSFPVPDKGWAVGHGGVVLHSNDAGATWVTQFDGQQASVQSIAYYESNAASIEAASQFADRERSLSVDGETQPFMSVFFIDEHRGYVVGTFNRMFHTEDGGHTWSPLMHRTENPGELHFYAIRGFGDQLHVAGEQGKVWRFSHASDRFIQASTPYNGTLFGLLSTTQNVLLAYGMRGSLYRSADQGDSWEKIDSTAQGAITSALEMPDGRLLIADQLGGLAQSRDNGRNFTALKTETPMPYFGATVVSDHHIALVGALGVRIETV